MYIRDLGTTITQKIEFSETKNKGTKELINRFLFMFFVANTLYSIRSFHKFAPTFVYTFHVSIYKHTAIGDQCT